MSQRIKIVTKRKRGSTAMRLRGLIRKEILQILRDPSSIAIAFLLPMVLLLLFGYGVSLDAEHVPIALVVEDQNVVAETFMSGFKSSRYFDPITYDGLKEAMEALSAHKVDGIVHIRQDFVKELKGSREAPIQVIVNGVDANNARLISGYIEGVYAKWLAKQFSGQDVNAGRMVPVQIEQRIWFNEEVRSQNFLVPGLVAVIMTLIGALLTALLVAREWERGTMEALLVSPVAMGEILLGKLIPYFILGMGGLCLSVAMAVWLFDVPLRGDLWVLFGASALFLLTALGMGLFISTLARSQFVASQAAIIATFLPAFILSGFIFDIGSMPPFIQAVTHIVAARYFVAILQSVFLAGNVWSVIIPNALALVVMAFVFLFLTRKRSKKSLE